MTSESRPTPRAARAFRVAAHSGRSGQSVEYFPDVQENHFIIKGWFHYYADTFYQKLFAAWALVGHLLNDIFGLGPKRKQVDFESRPSSS